MIRQIFQALSPRLLLLLLGVCGVVVAGLLVWSNRYPLTHPFTSLHSAALLPLPPTPPPPRPFLPRAPGPPQAVRGQSTPGDPPPPFTGHGDGDEQHRGQTVFTAGKPSTARLSRLGQGEVLPRADNGSKTVTDQGKPASNNHEKQSRSDKGSADQGHTVSSSGSRPEKGTEEERLGYWGTPLQDTPPQHGNRFLIFECIKARGLCGGWADRQEGLVTVFLLAYLTNRRFGIHMDTPCELTNFVVPNDYNWIVPDSELHGKSTRFIHGIDKSEFSREMPSVDFNARYPEDVVLLMTNRDLLTDITANPHYRDVLPSWAKQRRPEFFRDVWRTLMKPTPSVRQRLDSFLQTVHCFTTGRPLVGVHVRTGGSKQFADGQLGDRLQRIDQLWDFVQPYVQNGSDVFVATDNPDVRKSSMAKFGDHHLDTQAMLRHIDRQRQDPDICRALGDAILDQLILTRCGVLVVSPGSGFSSRAAMIRRRSDHLFEFGQQGVSPADMYRMCDPIC